MVMQLIVSSFFTNFRALIIFRQPGSNVTVVKSLVEPQPSMSSTNLSKKKNKETAPPNLDDFPQLDTSQSSGKVE
jgi:hypothetical protein